MILLWFALPYIVVSFAYNAPKVFRTINGFDYSYGIYIYAFPIQQAASQLGKRNDWTWLEVLTISLVFTIMFASLSWHFVEKPVLALKNKVIHRLKFA